MLKIDFVALVLCSEFRHPGTGGVLRCSPEGLPGPALALVSVLKRDVQTLAGVTPDVLVRREDKDVDYSQTSIKVWCSGWFSGLSP